MGSDIKCIMKNPDEEVNIGAFDPKKLYIRGGGGWGGVTHLYMSNNRNISSNVNSKR